RRDAHQQVDSKLRESEAEQCAAGSQHETFGEHLTDESAATAAKRGSYGELALTRRRTNEQQIGNVGAGDQQDERDGAHERENRRADIAAHVLVTQLRGAYTA